MLKSLWHVKPRARRGGDAEPDGRQACRCAVNDRTRTQPAATWMQQRADQGLREQKKITPFWTPLQTPKEAVRPPCQNWKLRLKTDF